MLIVLPSLVSGLGLLFILLAILIDQEIVRPVFLILGAILLWVDFFTTMAIFRWTVRSIDRRLRRIEADLPER